MRWLQRNLTLLYEIVSIYEQTRESRTASHVLINLKLEYFPTIEKFETYFTCKIGPWLVDSIKSDQGAPAFEGIRASMK